MSNDKRLKKVLNKYDDPTNLSPKNLEFGLWLAKNEKNIYKIIVITLASIATGFLLYSGYGYFYYFVFGREQDKTMFGDSSALNIVAYRLQNQALDLQISGVKSLKNNSSNDFVAHLKNPNEKHSASFSFCFTAQDQEFCGKSFILPGEEKDLIFTNNSDKKLSATPQFNIKDILWQKINAGEIPDWNVYRAQRLNFEISTPNFSRYPDNLYHLGFTIKNNSPFSYFEVPLNMIIKRGSEIIAVNRYVVRNLNSGEIRGVDLSWSEGANLGGTISIIPDLNILNQDVYRPYGTN